MLRQLLFSVSMCPQQVLRVLANTAHKKKDFCVQLLDVGLLPALCATLKMANQEMVTLSLDVLFMLLHGGPKVNGLHKNIYIKGYNEKIHCIL